MEKISKEQGLNTLADGQAPRMGGTFEKNGLQNFCLNTLADGQAPRMTKEADLRGLKEVSQYPR